MSGSIAMVAGLVALAAVVGGMLVTLTELALADQSFGARLTEHLGASAYVVVPATVVAIVAAWDARFSRLRLGINGVVLAGMAALVAVPALAMSLLG